MTTQEPKIEFNGLGYGKSDLHALSGAELVELYNEVAEFLDESLVTKFADKSVGAVRVWAILNHYLEAASQEEEEILPEVKPKGRRKRQMTFNFPLGEIKEPRKSKTGKPVLRDIVLERMKRGPTLFENVVQLVMQFDADRGIPSKNVNRRAYEVVRIIHYHLGYGMSQSEDGHITLITE